jgi:tripartite-type tricarboxylate transporter receptor subunit TctC
MTLRPILLALLLLLGAPLAQAQTVTQPVRLIVPFAPGGTVDILGRLLAEILTPKLNGRAVVVENRSGAGTFIAMQAVATAPADGHTLALAATTVLANAPIIPGITMPIDPDRTLKPVANLITVPIVLVGQPQAPFRSLPELIAYAKANPGKLNIGQAGLGGITHLLAERLAHAAGIRMEMIQYRGGTPALMDIMAGNSDLYFSLLGESLPYIQDGKLRPIAAASPQRLPALPDVPLALEVLPGFTGDVSYGIVVAAATPPDWVVFWNRLLGEAMRSPAMQARVRQLHWQDSFDTPEAYAAEILRLRREWQPIIQATGLRAGG